MTGEGSIHFFILKFATDGNLVPCFEILFAHSENYKTINKSIGVVFNQQCFCLYFSAGIEITMCKWRPRRHETCMFTKTYQIA